MRSMRSLGVALLAAALVAAAGCGGSSGSGPSKAGATVSLAPTAAGLYAEIDTDRSSAQWQALDAVLKKIPGAEGLIDDAIAQIGGNKMLDLQQDIEPALGPEVVIVLPAGAASPVVLAKPTDTKKFDSLLANAAAKPVTASHDGWTVVAQTQKDIDAYTAAVAQGSLADSAAYEQAMAGLPKDTLARIYVDGKGLAGAAGNAAGAAAGALKNIPIPAVGNLPGGTGKLDAKALAQLKPLGLALSAGDHVIRVDGSFAGGVTGYTPKLLRRVPADALAAFSISGGGSNGAQVRDALAGAATSGALSQLQKTLGVSLDDILGLLDGEGVLYVRPGLIIPEVTLMLAPKDPAAALRTLDGLVTKLAGRGGAKITTTTVSGVPFKMLTVSILGIGFGRDGDKLVISTQPSGYVDFDAGGDKLVDGDRFKQGAADVGYTGGKTDGLGFVDVKGLAPLLNTIGSAVAGSSSSSTSSLKKVVAALSAIDSVTFDTSSGGGRTRLHAVVRVG